MSERNTSPLNPAESRSLFALLAELPGLLISLVRLEIEQFKAQLSQKGQRIGIGAALILVAAIFALFGFGVLLACAVLALSLVVAGWLAALIVAAALFLLAVLLIFIGRGRIQAGLAENPLDVDIKRDIDVFKGEGSYDRRS